MKPLFVDTSGWMACADAGDPAHAAAAAARDAALRDGRWLVTTDYIADETLTLLRLRMGWDAAANWWRQVNSSQRLRWERIGPERFEAALRWFHRFRDKRFSFTDCTSFGVMRELGVEEALATDHHFKQAGFAILP